MKKLKNPYASFPEYNCFGCSPNNPLGLKMKFYESGDHIVSTWEPGENYQGFHDVLHGGIQATMMDEIASWLVFVKLDTGGVTYRMNLIYRRPVLISKGRITLQASLLKHERRLASIEVKLKDGEDNVCSEGEVEYFVLSREKAEKELRFPGKEAFYV
jgi:acyl-coenzyme A thioesterase PaaI-like protein